MANRIWLVTRRSRLIAIGCDVIGALEPEELQDFEAARKQYGSAAEDFINQCYGLHEAFALSLKPAKASAAIKERLMSMMRERSQNQSGSAPD